MLEHEVKGLTVLPVETAAKDSYLRVAHDVPPKHLLVVTQHGLYIRPDGRSAGLQVPPDDLGHDVVADGDVAIVRRWVTVGGQKQADDAVLGELLLDAVPVPLKLLGVLAAVDSVLDDDGHLVPGVENEDVDVRPLAANLDIIQIQNVKVHGRQRCLVRRNAHKCTLQKPSQKRVAETVRPTGLSRKTEASSDGSRRAPSRRPRRR